jgi:hypothetical protein
LTGVTRTGDDLQLDHADTRPMDGRDQLQSLARAIHSASDIEAAWAGTGPTVDVRKECGVCGEDQPVRVPFLRHVCRSCAAIWVPGICGDCAHTSVTFTVDGKLSAFARCGCGGGLRQVGYVPKPRVALDPEVLAARKVVFEQRKKRATWTSRTVLVVFAVLATVGALQLVHHNHAAPAQQTELPTRVSTRDDPTLTMDERGRLAAQRVRERGEHNDAFACAAELPAPVSTPSVAAVVPGTTAAVPPAAPSAPLAQGSGSKDFLAACLAG